MKDRKPHLSQESELGIKVENLYTVSKLFSECGDLASVMNELRARTLYYCPDALFRSRFEQEGVDWYRWRGLKYMLYAYERHLAEQAGEVVRMPWEIVARKEDTVEHVLPQVWDAGSYWAARFSLEREVIAHLAAPVGSQITVTLEIAAVVPAGVHEHVVRMVTENSQTLRFQSQGFEVK